MRDNLNAIKRLIAFVLCVLMVGTMVGNDLFVLATEENDCEEYVDDQTYAANVLSPVGEGDGYCDFCGQVEQSHVYEETAEAAEAAVEEVPTEETVETPVTEENVIADPTEEMVNAPDTTTDDSAPESEAAEESVASSDAENTPEDTEVIDEESEVETEIEEETEEEEIEEETEEECEHEWAYVSNGDGTHVKKCEKCGESSEEDCSYNDEGKCVKCGAIDEEESECEHEWTYVSNEDETHIKKCEKCGEEVLENCELDADGVCLHCGYEDNSLEFQIFSKTFHGTTVTVSGMMPRKSTVTIYQAGTKVSENIVNDNLDEGTFTAYEAYNINIYDRGGNKYQPEEDDNSVNVSFTGSSEIGEANEEEIKVFRIEEDYNITEIESEVQGENVYFEAEHFTIYVTGTYTNVDSFTLQSFEDFGTILTTTKSYTKVNFAVFSIYADDIDETYGFEVEVYKNSSESDLTSGEKIAYGSDSINPERVGWNTVAIPVYETVEGNGYIAAGETYSIVVSASDAIIVGYDGDGEDCPTYTLNADLTSWTQRTYNKVLYISTSISSTTGAPASISEYTTLTDGIKVSSISTSRAKNSSNKYIFAKGESNTLTAVLSSTGVSRTISWESSKPNVATIDSTQLSTGEMTATLNAVGTGETTIKAWCANYETITPVSITIVVIDFTIGGEAATEANAVESKPVTNSSNSVFNYTGSKVEPTVACTNTSDVSTIATTFDSNINAGTAKATIKVTSGGTQYTFVRYFTINPLNITTPGSDNKTAFAEAEFTVTDGSVTSVSNVNTNSALAVTPVFASGDFTVSVTNTAIASTGITYTFTIAGTGNFTGTISNFTYTPASLDVADLFTAVITLNRTYDGTEVTDANLWAATKFYDKSGNQLTDIITSSNANITVTDSSADSGKERIYAGTKTVKYTVTPAAAGYTGSVEATFTIKQEEMNNVDIIWTNGTGVFDHTGKEVKPEAGTDFKVYLGYNSPTDTGVEISTDEYKVDYIGSYVDTTDTPKIRLTGTGKNFDAETYKEKSYSIQASYALDLIVRITDSTGTKYDGTSKNGYATGYSRYYDATTTAPDFSVRLNGTLTEDTDYTYAIYDSYTSASVHTTLTKNVGTKYLVITGKGTYAGYDPIVATYTITARPLTTSGITVLFNGDSTATKVYDKTFNGVEQELSTGTASSDASSADITITYGTEYLQEGTDYTISYTGDTINVGTVSYSITAVSGGNYTGSITKSSLTYDIVKAEIGTDAKAAFVDTTTSFVYDGKAKTPSVIVTIGTTFSETYVYNTSSLDSANFSVSYDHNTSPTTSEKATITITGTNNLSGSTVLEFDITSNTDAYSAIYLGGTNLATYIETDSDGIRYYMCTSLQTTYTGSKYKGTPTVYHSTSTDPLKAGADYSYSAYNAKDANESTDYSSTSPYIKITGLGKYAGNNAIVYFNIQKASLKEATFGDFDTSYTWDGSTVENPSVEITYNSKTLTTDSESSTGLYGYTVAYYDTYNSDTGESTAATAAAGTKYAVFTGVGNFKDTVVKEYVVGTDISNLYYRILSPYYSVDTSKEVFAEFAKNTTTESAPLKNKVYWRNNDEPIVELYSSNSADTKLEDTDYTATTTTEIQSSSANSFVARESGSDSDNYNTVAVTIEGVAAKGYYGSMTIYYDICPQNISDQGTIGISSSGTDNHAYTGADITITPSLSFKYDGTNSYALNNLKNGGAVDYTPATYTIGPDYSATEISTTLYGCGNFTGSISVHNHVTKGNVKVYKKVESDDKPVLVGTTTCTSDSASYATTYALTDDECNYTYTGNEQCPTITLTTTDEANPLTLTRDTDYTITYPEDMINPGTKTITVVTSNNNIWNQTITITYVIKSNSIENFSKHSLSDITYEAKANILPSDIKSYIASGKTTISVGSDSKTLEYGTDYEIVDESATTANDELTAIKAQLGTAGDSAKLYGTNSAPSYDTTGATNYIWVKGIGAYSGYLKVPFSIVLDLSVEAYAHVSMAASEVVLSNGTVIPYYELDAAGEVSPEPMAPIIKYRAPGGTVGTYTETLLNTVSTDVYNYTMTRGNDGKPGPDPDISITGQYTCTGTVDGLKYEYGSTELTVCFLADLSTYEGIVMTSDDVVDYTGEAIYATFRGLDGVKATSESTGDYKISYKFSDEEKTNYALKVGEWTAIIEATEESTYYKYGTSTSNKFTFKVKYNLSKSTMKFYATDNTTEITSTGYTGSTFSILESVIIYAQDGTTKIYDYDGEKTEYVTITPTSVTKMGSYEIRATANTITGTDYCYGSLTGTFSVTGISIENAEVTLEYTTTVYSGTSKAPTVTVKIGDVILVKGTDYTVQYTGNINAGTATVKVIGKDNYSGTKTTTFTIEQKPLTADMITVGEAYYAGTNSELKIEPTVTVANGSVTLVEGTDYQEITSSSYTNNSSIATSVVNANVADTSQWTYPQVTVTAVDGGNYSGSATKKFEIEKLDVTSAGVTISPDTTEYTGSTIDPYDIISLTTTYNGTTTKLTKYDASTKVGDYTLTVLNSAGANTELKAMGTYNIKITGMNSCDYTKTITFEVTKRSLADNYHYYYTTASGFVGTWEYKSDLYSGDADTTPGYITSGGFTSSSSDATYVDSLTIYIEDVISVTSGVNNVPTVKIIDSEVRDTTTGANYELIEGTDFTLSVSNATSSGSAAWNRTATTDYHATVASTSPAVTITGMGNYTDSITLPFNIGKNINTLELQITYKANGTEYAYDANYDNPSADSARWQFTYNGNPQTPSVVVKNSSGTTLVKGKAYTISYTDDSGNTDSSINAGYKHVVITGIGDYCGTMSQEYSINRKQITAVGGPYTNESPMKTTDSELTFSVLGTKVTRFTTATAKKYLADTGLLSETDAANFVGYYYAIYDGEAIEPSVTVTDNTLGTSGSYRSGLISDSDLDITYTNSDMVSTFTTVDGTMSTNTSGDICIKFSTTGNAAQSFGTGNYYTATTSVEYHIKYIILEHDISSDFVVSFVNGTDGDQYTYNGGKTIEPEIQVTNGSRYLTEGEEYDVEYSDNIVPGEATVTVTGIGNYRGTKSLTFDIWGDLSDTEAYSKDSEGHWTEVMTQQYTGKAITAGDPQVYLVLPASESQTTDVVLTYGTNYYVSDSSTTDSYVTDGTVVYTGLASTYWTGSKEVNYDIAFDEENVTANNYEESYKYTGYDIIPDFGLSISTAEIGTVEYYRTVDEALVETSDFTSLGTITAKIPYSIGTYSGTVTAEYAITSRPISNCTIVLATTQRYTGRQIKPAFTVFIASKNLKTGASQTKTLTAGTDYSVEYGTKLTGADYMTLMGITDEITGVAYPSYAIKLGKITNLKVAENTGDSLTASWTRDIYSDGAEVILQRMVDGIYVDYKTGTTTGKTTTYKFTGLTSSTNYQIKVRSYATPSGSTDKIYSDFTTIKTATDVAESDITVASNAAGKATVSWNTEGDVTLYYIYRASDSTSDGTIVAIIPASTGSFTNSGLTSGSTYYYHVVGYYLSNAKLTKISESDHVAVTIQ